MESLGHAKKMCFCYEKRNDEEHDFRADGNPWSRLLFSGLRESSGRLLGCAERSLDLVLICNVILL